MGLSNWVRSVLKKLFEVSRKQHSQSEPQSAHISSKHYTDLTRFIFDARHFSKAKERVKPGAFLPEADLKTSALGKDGLKEAEIWGIGLLVGRDRGKPPKARADFSPMTVSKAALTIEHAPLPDIPNHINLCGWPSEKDEQKLVWCPGNAKIKELTGASYMVMDADVPVVESGGKADFQYGSRAEFLIRRPRSIACCTMATKG